MIVDPLYDYLKSNTLTWNELCHIKYCTARGLMHLHEEILSERFDQCKPIIVHRDLKSKNVLLKHDFSACISDFGVAVVLRHGKLCGDVHTRVCTSRFMVVLDVSIDYSRAQLGAVPEYMLPFEEEIEQHPSFKDIAKCIVNKRLKPAFKDNWKKSHSGLRDLCQTIEECWTHCAEDRISVRCVFERCCRWQYRRNETQWSRWSLNLPIELDEIPSTS